MGITLRPFQKQAIEALTKENNVICIAPTGSGKSYIFENIAKKKGIKTLLVSPLIALARQQKLRLEASGLSVSIACGNEDRTSKYPNNKTDVWIISPESLLTSRAESVLYEWRPNFLVVDECHCLWEWGDGFRPAFRSLPKLLNLSSVTRSIWLTATMPQEARRQLVVQIGQRPITEIGRFGLPEKLSIKRERISLIERLGFLYQWVLSHNDSGIIFVTTREAAERLRRFLSRSSRLVVHYHAGMSKEERLTIENMLSGGTPLIVVATSAFGMGMDYRHLRWAVLWQAPRSLLNLAQAIGRVGRANEGGEALILWDNEDFFLLERITADSNKREMLAVWNYLNSRKCPREGLVEYFD